VTGDPTVQIKSSHASLTKLLEIIIHYHANLMPLSEKFVVLDSLLKLSATQRALELVPVLFEPKDHRTAFRHLLTTNILAALPPYSLSAELVVDLIELAQSEDTVSSLASLCHQSDVFEVIEECRSRDAVMSMALQCAILMQAKSDITALLDTLALVAELAVEDELFYSTFADAPDQIAVKPHDEDNVEVSEALEIAVCELTLAAALGALRHHSAEEGGTMLLSILATAEEMIGFDLTEAQRSPLTPVQQRILQLLQHSFSEFASICMGDTKFSLYAMHQLGERPNMDSSVMLALARGIVVDAHPMLWADPAFAQLASIVRKFIADARPVCLENETIASAHIRLSLLDTPIAIAILRSYQPKWLWEFIEADFVEFARSISTSEQQLSVDPYLADWMLALLLSKMSAWHFP
jgi:hypothetical protein